MLILGTTDLAAGIGCVVMCHLPHIEFRKFGNVTFGSKERVFIISMTLSTMSRGVSCRIYFFNWKVSEHIVCESQHLTIDITIVPAIVLLIASLARIPCGKR